MTSHRDRRQVENFLQDEDLISGEIGWQLYLQEVGLNKEGRLEVGCFEVNMIELRAQAHRCDRAVHPCGDE
jgi:hypothetical protein